MEMLKILVKNMETKQKIRKDFLRIRKQMQKEDVICKSQQICHAIINMNIWDNISSIFVYSPINNEVDLQVLVEWARSKNIIVCFPKVTEDDMFFYRIDKDSMLEEGYFKIKEPAGNEEIFEADSKTIIFVPGNAFDIKGYRVGYGKGFYDKYLNKYSSAKAIGVAYEWQIIKEIEYDSFDVSMDIIVSEKGEVKMYD